MELWSFCLAATGTDDTRAPLSKCHQRKPVDVFNSNLTAASSSKQAGSAAESNTHLHTQRW